MRILPPALVVAILTCLLASCGQKGPLYLPVTPPRTIPAMPGAATHAPAATSRAPAAATHPAAASD
ncbi:MAG: LPS translocon maturation chaperone LptM [Gammaproteobacteria bacterium]